VLELDGFVLSTPNCTSAVYAEPIKLVFIVTSAYLTAILILSSNLCPGYLFYDSSFSDLESKIMIENVEGIIRIL
jgi:hypothetical protein